MAAMNKRLGCIASHIPFGRGLIDVGTDHGYLPLSLAENGYPGRLIASDIHSGPLSKARAAAVEAGLAGRIEFQLCDGLENCDPEAIDTVVIAGMGGDTISGILDRAEWCLSSRYTLVLQPMTRAEVLRYWLVYNGFRIEAEDLVEDGGLLYPVLVARFGGVTRLNDAELFTGSAELLCAHPLFPRLVERQIDRFEAILRGMSCAERTRESARAKLLREILAGLKEMERHENEG